MKRIKVWALLGAVVAFVAAFTSAPNPAPVILEWYYPTNHVTPDLSVSIYHTNDLSVSMTNWNLVASGNISNYFYRTVGATNTYRFTNMMTLQYDFFYLRASNSWGLSDPSSVAALSPASSDRLQILKGW